MHVFTQLVELTPESAEPLLPLPELLLASKVVVQSMLQVSAQQLTSTPAGTRYTVSTVVTPLLLSSSESLEPLLLLLPLLLLPLEEPLDLLPLLLLDLLLLLESSKASTDSLAEQNSDSYCSKKTSEEPLADPPEP